MCAADEPRVLDERLELQLVAGDGELHTPVAVATDRDGVVYVIENHSHFTPDEYEHDEADRILWFRDADGDGAADERGVFFKGGRDTMGLAFDFTQPDVSLLVATRREIFRLRDGDGDRRADSMLTWGSPHSQRDEGVLLHRIPDDEAHPEKKILLSLETDEIYPHDGLAGFAINVDGGFYFGIGENLGAEYKIHIQGARQPGAVGDAGEGGSVFYYDARHQRVTRVATGFWNPFHQYLDPFGRLFVVDNDPDSRPPCRLLHVVQDGDYGYRFGYGRPGTHPFQAWNGELPGTLPMIAGTGEAPSAVVGYEADLLPQEFRGQLLVTSWGDHRIEAYRLIPQGASFRAERTILVQGDEDFRPVGMAVAPDGSVYFSDWVDKSYPVHGRGRLWRLTARSGAFENPEEDLKYPLAAARDLLYPREGMEKMLETAQGPRNVVRANIPETIFLHSTDARTRGVTARLIHFLEGRDYGAGDARLSLSIALSDESSEVRATAVERFPPGRLASFREARRGQDLGEFAFHRLNPSPDFLLRYLLSRSPLYLRDEDYGAGFQPEAFDKEYASAEKAEEALAGGPQSLSLPFNYVHIETLLSSSDPFLRHGAREYIDRKPLDSQPVSWPAHLWLRRDDLPAVGRREAAVMAPIHIALLELDAMELEAEIARIGGESNPFSQQRRQEISEAKRHMEGFLLNEDAWVRFIGVKRISEYLAEASPAPDLQFTEQDLWDMRTHYAARFRAMLPDAETPELFAGILAGILLLEGEGDGEKAENVSQQYIVEIVVDEAAANGIRSRALRMLSPDHPALTVELLTSLFDADDTELRKEAVHTLIARAALDEASKRLLHEILTDEDFPDDLRATGILGLSAADAEDRALLVELAANTSDEMQVEALRTLVGVDLTEEERAELQTSMQSIGVNSPTMNSLLRRVLKADATELVQPPLNAQEFDELVTQLTDEPVTQEQVAAGERLFFHPHGPACFRCHRIAGRGGAVGPDLSRVAGELTPERLIESIIEPDKEVAPQYTAWTVTTTDGRILTSMLLAETTEGGSRWLDEQGHEFELAADEVETRTASNLSIMPSGLAADLSAEELRNLLAYLRTLQAGWK